MVDRKRTDQSEKSEAEYGERDCRKNGLSNGRLNGRSNDPQRTATYFLAARCTDLGLRRASDLLHTVLTLLALLSRGRGLGGQALFN